MTLICGIDEAGRGPVIGPMVIVGVLVDDLEEDLLKGLGVKDSKLLSPAVREEKFEKIKQIVRDFKVIIISPKEIDKAVYSEESNLNWLEADTSIAIIEELKPEVAYIDCPSNNIKNYSEYIKMNMKLGLREKVKLIAEHKADQKYTVVSAASILAKVIRDREINKIKKQYKVNFGSGYPSDPFTKNFLEDNYDKYPFFRKSWASWRNVAKKKGQRTLVQF